MRALLVVGAAAIFIPALGSVAAQPGEVEIRPTRSHTVLAAQLGPAPVASEPLEDPQAEAARQLGNMYGLSTDAAAKTIAQQSSVNQLDTELKSTGSAGILGVWIDWPAGAIVRVASVQNADLELARSLAAKLGLTITATLVDHSYAELESTQKLIDSGADPVIKEESRGSYIDVAQDAVVVEVDEALIDDMTTALRSAARTDVTVIGSPGTRAAACTSRQACGTPLRGGICIRLTSPCTGTNNVNSVACRSVELCS